MTVDCVSPISLLQSFTAAPTLKLACQIILESVTEPTEMTAKTYLIVFLLTCVIEGPVYWWATKNILTPLRRLLLIVWLNLATHPIVTWVFPLIFAKLHRPYRETVLASELFAPLIEAMLLKFQYKLSWRKAIFTSGFANVLSWWGGFYVAYLLGLAS